MPPAPGRSFDGFTTPSTRTQRLPEEAETSAVDIVISVFGIFGFVFLVFTVACMVAGFFCCGFWCLQRGYCNLFKRVRTPRRPRYSPNRPSQMPHRKRCGPNRPSRMPIRKKYLPNRPSVRQESEYPRNEGKSQLTPSKRAAAGQLLEEPGRRTPNSKHPSKPSRQNQDGSWKCGPSGGEKNDFDGSHQSQDEVIVHYFSPTTAAQKEPNADFVTRMSSFTAPKNLTREKPADRSCLSTSTSFSSQLSPRCAARFGFLGSQMSHSYQSAATTTRIQLKIPEQGRTERQTTLLASLRHSWTTREADAVELFPGCQRYLPGARFEDFKGQLNPKHPMIDAVSLTLLFFGSADNILELFPGDLFGLKHAFGGDMLRDVLGYINRYHPGVAAKKVPPITEEELIQAFSGIVYCFRKSHDVDKSGYDGDTSL